MHSSVLRQTPSCHGGNLYVRYYLSFLASRDNSSRWEYIITIQFEWQIVTGQRKYRWTVLVRFADRFGLWSPPDTRSRTGAKLYSGCRLSTLLAIVLIFVEFDSTTPMDCKVSVPSTQPTPCSTRTCCSWDWFWYMCVCWCPQLIAI